MVFQSDTYSVLLVSASEKWNTAMTSVLPSTDFWPIRTVRSLSQARRLTLENPSDLIIVNSPLPDGNGLPLSQERCWRTACVCCALCGSGCAPQEKPSPPWRKRWRSCA